MAALAGVLDDIVEQVSPVGSLLDMLQGLKLADRLGLGWYDDAIGALQRAPGFPQVAQALGDFANTIDDLNALKQVGQLDVEAGGAYRILEGDAGKVMDNFARQWGATVHQRADGTWEVLKPDGSVRMTLYRSSSIIEGPDTNLPTLFLNESGATQKIRFGSSTYPLPSSD